MQLETFCHINPYMEYLTEFDMKSTTEWYGIKALWYEGVEYRGKKTKVFAHIGYPQMEEGEKVPAVVLVHGGGGHAYPEWIRKWNERGFAAIAMNTTGYVPSEDWKGLAGTEMQIHGAYVHELYGSLAEEGYTLGPDNSEMKDYELPIEEQWMYHAVADTILAHNILLNDAKVDVGKTGIVGISWGAVIASIAIGYDTRYAFGVPIYGSGYLDYQPAPKLPKIFRNSVVKKLWSAADRFEKVNFPIFWHCGCHDHAFSIGANSLSYQATKKSNSFLCMLLDFPHGHQGGWNPPNSYRFASEIVNDRLPFIRTVTEPDNFGEISFQIEIPEDFINVSAEILYLTEPMEYDENNHMTKEWKSVTAKIHQNCVKGIVPEDAYCYFVEMKGYVDGECYATSCALVERGDSLGRVPR